MMDWLLKAFVRSLLWLRYRIRVKGRLAIVSRGKSKIIFLPNHPALIDPIMLLAHLWQFEPRALADEDQVDRFFIRFLAKRAGVVSIPSMSKAGLDADTSAEEIELGIAKLVECLARGENVLLYPSGHLCRNRMEELGGNSAVETLLRAVPDARVVLVRTRGLWGSSFGWASGREPSVADVLGKGLKLLLASGMFFAPRRKLDIELTEPDDLPRLADRTEINRYLEDFYNADAPPATYVPYTIWERGGARELPEPEVRSSEDALHAVPDGTRRIVTEFIGEVSGTDRFADDALLGSDLGMDSLARSELLMFLQKEFGFPQGNVDSLRTVGDVMLAACGESMAATEISLRPVAAKWFANEDSRLRGTVLLGPGGELPDNVCQAFLDQARRTPNRPVVADQTSGVKTFRDVVTAVMVLRPEIAKLPGDHIGIMLPASVGADILYLATLFAGKTPVMVNWTVGPRNIAGGLDRTEVSHVLTAKALVQRVSSQGVEFGEVEEKFIYLEELGASITTAKKLKAWLGARFNWRSLRTAEVPKTAAILFTSGSETLPKAVPLTHANLLRNISDATEMFELLHGDRLLGFLPPFHSFGLTVGILIPLCMGVPVVYHANPAEAALLGKMIETYRATIVLGTPTFLSGIVRVSTSDQLASLRLAVTGAEKCPDRVYQALAERCPQMVVIEGYGVTECSPIVSVNDADDPRQGTIGRVLRSFEYAIVDEDLASRVETGNRGQLLVRGPCVFGGYLGDAPSPFIEFEGEQWYHTGDLVAEDDKGVLTFHGRLKRFVKIGGEMISLPAIEAVLEQHFSREDEGPVLAVEADYPKTDGGEAVERPELVLFVAETLGEVDREAVNDGIREGGLSPLHNVRRVIPIEEIPLLGTGKTDYRSLKSLLNDR